jgi:predicted NBD/HSP70 family sugar kinase
MTDGRERPNAATGQPGIVAGIDIGGTKIAVLIVDADGAVLGRATHSSSVGDQGGAVGAIAAALDEALAVADLQRGDLEVVGVGVPGRVDTTKGRVTLAVNLGWTDFALRDGLQLELGRPVVIENDVRAAALGLHTRGLVDGDLAYLAVGTGIAGGVILDGRLHRGARGLAGEIGHAIAEPGGRRCTCGQLGCLEAFVSGPSIARRAVEAGADVTTTARDVYLAAAAGDPHAEQLVDDVGRRLAWAVHVLVMAYDVHRIVVGGGVSHAGRPFEAPLRRELERLRSASDQAAELLPPDIVEVLPPEAEPGAWGAVAVARQAGVAGPSDRSDGRGTAKGSEVVRPA